MKLSSIVNNLLNSNELFDRFLALAIILICFFPAWLYRWSLKATCWFYLPLVYILSEGKNKKHFLTEQSGGVFSGLRFFLALVTFAFVILFLAPQTFLTEKLSDKLPPGLPLAEAANYLWNLDFSRFRLWQWLNLYNAFVTLFIFFTLNQIFRVRKYDDTESYGAGMVTFCYILSKLRTVSLISFILINLALFALYATNIEPHLHPTLKAQLEGFYGIDLPVSFLP